MNEFDIMRDISHCIKHECKLCPRNGKGYCAVELMKDANCVLKMQADALKGFPTKVEELENEIRRLTPLARYSFDEVDLVRAVNNIASACYDAEIYSNSEDDENSYVTMLHAFLRLGDMLPSKYKVVIRGMDSAPELVKDL